LLLGLSQRAQLLALQLCPQLWPQLCPQLWLLRLLCSLRQVLPPVGQLALLQP
jgi:hypothetical protein